MFPGRAPSSREGGVVNGRGERGPRAEYETNRLKVWSDGSVRHIKLYRPEKRNAFDSMMIEEFIFALGSPPRRDERVSVISAEGTVFSAGVDLKERAASGTPKGASPIEAALEAIDTHPLPVIARVQGPAIAGGCEIAIACDFVIASTSASFSMPLARFGQTPTWGLTIRLLEALGLTMTRELLLTGRSVSSETLKRARLITGAVPPGDLDNEVEALVDALASASPESVRLTKAMLVRARRALQDVAHDDLDEFADEIRTGAGARDGVKARLHKSLPKFATEKC